VLDPGWESGEAVGEALLAEPSSVLLAMGKPGAAGVAVEEPESFS
jgi:hypothetical protein